MAEAILEVGDTDGVTYAILDGGEVVAHDRDGQALDLDSEEALRRLTTVPSRAHLLRDAARLAWTTGAARDAGGYNRHAWQEAMNAVALHDFDRADADLVFDDPSGAAALWLVHPDAPVRRRVLDWLAAAPPAKVRPWHQSAADRIAVYDPDPGVRDAAGKALRAVGKALAD